MLSRSLVLTTLLLIAGLETLSAQDIYVRIRGKVLNGDDSTTAVRASLLYEKLPYYDDMGKIANTADGDFEFYLIKDIAYNISINEGGFEPYSNQLQVVDADGDKSMDVNFYLKPVEVPEELEEEIFVLQNLIFTSGSDVIQRGSYPGLDEFVAWMKDRPSYVVQLEGHTDIAGNPNHYKNSEAIKLLESELIPSNNK